MSIERLMAAARAAGFAMATPDDLHAMPSQRRPDVGTWKPAVPAVIEKPDGPQLRAAPRSNVLREWVALLSFRTSS